MPTPLTVSEPLIKLCSDCFGPIVSIPLPNCQVKFLSDREKLPPIF